MKIAVVAPFEERVPPVKYGGTELVVSNLVEELVRAGYDVTLLAAGDSQTRAHFVPIFTRALREMPELNTSHKRDAYKFMGVGKVVTYLSQHEFDIIHNHIGWRLLPFEGALRCPVITTLHGPLDIEYQQDVYGHYRQANYVSISHSQRRPMPNLNFVANVYNGIRIERFSFSETPENYFVFLGRMSPEKGPVQAIQIAKASGIKLIMAAKVDLVDEVYFKKEIEPLIDGEQIRFIGEVDHEEKVKLLAGARALIAPIQWEEPFGLFFIEAMACGTPVITMRRGSVPEIIIDHKTGFICDNLEEAIARVKDVDTLRRADCAEHVRQNFSSTTMMQGYIQAYHKVIRH